MRPFMERRIVGSRRCCPNASMISLTKATPSPSRDQKTGTQRKAMLFVELKLLVAQLAGAFCLPLPPHFVQRGP